MLSSEINIIIIGTAHAHVHMACVGAISGLTWASVRIGHATIGRVPPFWRRRVLALQGRIHYTLWL